MKYLNLVEHFLKVEGWSLSVAMRKANLNYTNGKHVDLLFKEDRKRTLELMAFAAARSKTPKIYPGPSSKDYRKES